jgi:SAM-dependent methyltransferase
MNQLSFYEKNGIASLDDLQAPEWKSVFEGLARIQEDLYALHIHTSDYIWPTRPLEEQTRPWEYPFVYSNLQKVLALSGEPGVRMADLGSGFTFFPYALARIGAHVTCVDMDPIPGRLYEAASRLMPTGSGSIVFREGDLNRIPLEDSSVDIAYSISVLEHMPVLDKAIEEVHRILKKGGHFVLTFDVDCLGNFELGPVKWKGLREILAKDFDPVFPETVIHPQRMLTNLNHPFVPRVERGKFHRILRELYSINKKYLLSNVFGITRGYFITSYGGCYKKRSR